MRLRNFFKIVPLFAVAAWSLSPGAAHAATLTLVDPAPANQQYQQTANSPCVVGESSCKDPNPDPIPGSTSWSDIMGLIPPNTSPYDVSSSSSPSFTVGEIAAVVGKTFIIGIDVNTATGADLATEFLDFFGVYVNGALIYSYGDTNPATPGTQLHNTNNGNGYADSLLQTVDLSAFADSATVVFRAIVSNATDGREEFFLINTSSPPPVIPEPASLTLLGGGLLGMAGALRRRIQKARKA